MTELKLCSVLFLFNFAYCLISFAIVFFVFLSHML